MRFVLVRVEGRLPHSVKGAFGEAMAFTEVRLTVHEDQAAETAAALRALADELEGKESDVERPAG